MKPDDLVVNVNDNRIVWKIAEIFTDPWDKHQVARMVRFCPVYVSEEEEYLAMVQEGTLNFDKLDNYLKDLRLATPEEIARAVAKRMLK